MKMQMSEQRTATIRDNIEMETLAGSYDEFAYIPLVDLEGLHIIVLRLSTS
jgi:hypothetical protein